MKSVDYVARLADGIVHLVVNSNIPEDILKPLSIQASNLRCFLTWKRQPCLGQKLDFLVLKGLFQVVDGLDETLELLFLLRTSKV